MIRSPILLRTALKSSQHAVNIAASAVATSTRTRGGSRETTVALARLTTTATANDTNNTRTFSTARHDDDHDSEGGPPPSKNTFGGHFDWMDPLNIKSQLTEEEVHSFYCIRDVCFVIAI